VWRGSAGGDEYRRTSCRASCGALANEASGCLGRASPCGRAGAEAPGPSHVGPRRPCPRRARSIGIWRSATVNNGRSHTDLTCAIGVVSGVDGLPGRAFQARDRWGHSWATNDRITADNTGHHRFAISPAHRADSVICAGNHDPPKLSRTEEASSRPGRESGRLRRPSSAASYRSRSIRH
jgi:hypothetical protein